MRCLAGMMMLQLGIGAIEGSRSRSVEEMACETAMALILEMFYWVEWALRGKNWVEAQRLQKGFLLRL